MVLMNTDFSYDIFSKNYFFSLKEKLVLCE